MFSPIPELFSKYSSPAWDKPKRLLPWVLLTLLTTLAFFRYWNANLLYFDDNTLFSDLTLKNISGNPIYSIFSSPYLFGTYFRPVASLTLFFETNFTPDPAVFAHRTNLVLHLLTVLLLYAALRRQEFSKIISFFTAAFFAVAPLQTNALGWIAGRSDLLGGLFAVIGLYILSRLNSQNKYLMAALLLPVLLLAVLSKENLLLLPVLIMCLGCFTGYRQNTKHWMPVTVASALSFAGSLFIWHMTHVAERGRPLLIQNLWHNFHQIPETVGKIFVIWKIIPLPDHDPVSEYFGWIIILLIFCAGYSIKAERNRIWAGLAFFFILMLPGLAVRTVVFDSHLYWDCRSYAPLLGLAFSSAAMLHTLRPNIWLRTFGAILILIFCIQTIRLSETYTTGEKFWGKVIQNYPDKPAGYAGITICDLQTGKLAQARLDADLAMNAFPQNQYLVKSLGDAFEQKYEFGTVALLYERFLNTNVTQVELVPDIVRNYALAGDSAGLNLILAKWKLDSSKILAVLRDNRDYFNYKGESQLVQNLDRAAAIIVRRGSLDDTKKWPQ